MPELQPAGLAALVDHAERPRAGDWSLRAALVRLAQFRPGLVRDLMEPIRRLDHALHTHRARLLADGPALWASLTDGVAQSDEESARLVALLGVARELDALADVVVTWAEDRRGPMPEDAVAETAPAVSRRLDELGVPREEERPPPAGGRGPRRRRG
ncbi:MAG: hypothetical protein ACO1PW_08280 [Actinomycetota bacterium]